MNEQSDHLAIQANMDSIRFASQGNKEAWLDLYADDATVQDPVGVSPFDSTGDGHIGKEAIAKFWDDVIGPSNVSITVHKRIASGDRACAVHQSAVNEMGDDIKTEVDMMAVYELNEQGKIQRMSAFWSWAAMEDQLKKMGLM